MKKAFTRADLRRIINESNVSPKGFIPTMGALHKGHLSLVSRGISECPEIIVSIFVNPTQFNDKEDLKNYPRPVERDLKMLSGIMRENDVVFMPQVEEIYPEEDTRIFDFGNVGKVMEGAHRPGHFNGVGQVVTRLFDIVRPDTAYFGQKDLQQVAVIKELVRQTGYGIRIISCPIIREADGLAMSSRNELLEPGIRKNAGVIFKALSWAAGAARSADLPEIKSEVRRIINSTPGFKVEYFEIADDSELIPVHNKSEVLKGRKYFGCIAVKAGKIRLIDNTEISLL